MDALTKEQKKEMLDAFGERLVKKRDVVLEIAMKIATQTTINPGKQKQYCALSGLSTEQQEAVCDLLSEVITNIIYSFFNMVEENAAMMKLVLIKNGTEYNMVDISEELGSEITFHDDSGWIQRFSKIGRFVS